MWEFQSYFELCFASFAGFYPLLPLLKIYIIFKAEGLMLCQSQD